tara:strand:+ start:1269 stop:1544 length:276 start_codon:yes stop_codon:yes gene_type:complete
MTKPYRVMHVPKPVELLLSTAEVNRIAIQRVCDVYNWNPDWYITHTIGSSFVTEEVQAHTTHSFSYETTIREASAEDIMIVNLLEKLKETK